MNQITKGTRLSLRFYTKYHTTVESFCNYTKASDQITSLYQDICYNRHNLHKIIKLKLEKLIFTTW